MGYLGKEFFARARFALVVAAFLVFTAGAAAAEQSWAYDLAGELMSPYCPGRTLASCPSPQAAELVQWMVLQDAAGSTQEEVIDILVERFGEEILGAPRAKGIGLWAYILPVLGFVVGGGLAVVVLRRIVAGGSAEPVTSPPPTSDAIRPVSPAASAASDEDLARLVDAELAARS